MFMQAYSVGGLGWEGAGSHYFIVVYQGNQFNGLPFVRHAGICLDTEGLFFFFKRKNDWIIKFDLIYQMIIQIIKRTQSAEQPLELTLVRWMTKCESDLFSPPEPITVRIMDCFLRCVFFHQPWNLIESLRQWNRRPFRESRWKLCANSTNKWVVWYFTESCVLYTNVTQEWCHGAQPWEVIFLLHRRKYTFLNCLYN